MPVSKKRKKGGKPVGNGEGKNYRRASESDIPTGVTFQDLINVLAYQEYVKDGTIVPEKRDEGIDFEDPDTQAVIRAVDSIDIEEHQKETNEDGR